MLVKGFNFDEPAYKSVYKAEPAYKPEPVYYGPLQPAYTPVYKAEPVYTTTTEAPTTTTTYAP